MIVVLFDGEHKRQVRHQMKETAYFPIMHHRQGHLMLHLK